MAVALRLAEAELPAERGYRAPSTALETAIARIVSDLLGQADTIGVDDDFFGLWAVTR